MEDDEIRAALRRGDEGAAFGLLLQAHGKTIFARCHRILHDETAAEDVMQQVLIAAFKHRKKLIQVESIRGWLICGAVRRCIDAIRSGERVDRLERDLAASSVPEQAGVLEQLRNAQEQRALRECLATLEPQLAAAMEMWYRDEMSWAEIAAAVALPVDTIRMRVVRALKPLRHCLEAKEVTR